MPFLSFQFETPWRRWVLYFLIGFPALYLVYMLGMYLFQNKAIFPGVGKTTTFPAQLGMPAEDIVLKTPDGEQLAAWFIPAGPAAIADPAGASAIAMRKPCVLMCEGNAENKGDRLAQIFYWHRLGVHAFVWDYRGYAESTGSVTCRNARADVRLALAYILSRPDVDPAKIILDGHSIGSGVAATLLPEFQPAAVVLEAPFSSLAEAAQDNAPLLPVRWLLEDNYDTRAKLEQYAGPVLIMASRRDELFNPAHADRLHRASKNAMLVWDDGAHADQRQGGLYGTTIEAFLTDNHLIPPRPEEPDESAEPTARTAPSPQ